MGGKLGPNLVIAVRNHGLGRGNAGELVKRLFSDIGNAGGHRNMAKAIVPMRRWGEREHVARKADIEHRLRELFTKGILGETEAANGRVQAAGSRGG